MRRIPLSDGISVFTVRPMPSPGTTRSTLLAGLAAALLSGGCSASGLELHEASAVSRTANRVVVYDCLGAAQVAPLMMPVSCFTESRVAFRLKWRDWGRATATGVGIMQCDCAPRGRVRARIDLRDITADPEGGPSYYRVVDVTLPGRPGSGALPPGEPRTRHYDVFDGMLFERPRP